MLFHHVTMFKRQKIKVGCASRLYPKMELYPGSGPRRNRTHIKVGLHTKRLSYGPDM